MSEGGENEEVYGRLREIKDEQEYEEDEDFPAPHPHGDKK